MHGLSASACALVEGAISRGFPWGDPRKEWFLLGKIHENPNPKWMMTGGTPILGNLQMGGGRVGRFFFVGVGSGNDWTIFLWRNDWMVIFSGRPSDFRDKFHPGCAPRR